MKPVPSMMASLARLFACLSRRRRRQLVLLVLLMLLGAIAEVASIGAIVPFLAMLLNPGQALEAPVVGRLIAALGFPGDIDVRWQITIAFASVALLAGAVRLVLIAATARINFGIGHELGAEVYRRTLYWPYEAHLRRNSSEIMGGLQKVDVLVVVVFGILTACSATVMSLFIVIALVAIDPIIAASAVVGFGVIYVAVSLISRKRLAINSRVLSSASNIRLQFAQEGLGGIRDVLLDHSQPYFSRQFNQIDWAMRRAQASNSFIGPSPRYVVEALGMVLMAFLGYKLTATRGGIADAIPILGALALGAQRLMPLLQQIYQGWAVAAGNRNVLVDVVDLLQEPDILQMPADVEPMCFNCEIRVRGLSFRYDSQTPLVLSEITLDIPKGARVGFIGATGSGKSTLMDLLMGLLKPSVGEIQVDGVLLDGAARPAWQRNVAHVPQSIYLSDASFAENIAFGVAQQEIDFERVRRAASQAQIAEFIESFEEGYAGTVGERGVRLSGGQRQRIGIARALYKKASVLVFDEATSALDTETESAVMDAINQLGRDLTIIIIAHRLSTLDGCDVVYSLDNGRLVA